MAVIVDTGLLLASHNRRDRHHDASAAFFDGCDDLVIVPQLVAGEAAYMLERILGPVAAGLFLTDIARGALIDEAVHAADWARIADLVLRYHSLPLGAVDASVVAAAERLGITTIATFDRRDFAIVRPRHVEAFELLP